MNGSALTLGLVGALAAAATLRRRGSADLDDRAANQTTWYHGRSTRSMRFDLRFVGGEEANDQEGPGFYFTNDPEGARGYAYPKRDRDNQPDTRANPGVVLAVRLRVPRWVDPTRRANRTEVERLLRASPCYREELENWDENPVRAHANAMRGMMSAEWQHGVFQNVWGDFYRRCDGGDAAYLDGLVKLGYGGVRIPQPDGPYRMPGTVHAVVFSPAFIEDVRVHEDLGVGSVER